MIGASLAAASVGVATSAAAVVVEAAVIAVTASASSIAAGAGWFVAVWAALGLFWLRATLVRRALLVAEAAHELRGPLCAAGLALHGASGDARRLAAVELELRRAGLALEDLVRAPRGGRVPELPERVDAVDLAREVVAAWRPFAGGFGADVRLEAATAAAVAVSVRADRLRVTQAVANLVGNAAEHGVGDVVVRVSADSARVRIAVRDDGTGPDPALVAAAVRAGAGPVRALVAPAGGGARLVRAVVATGRGGAVPVQAVRGCAGSVAARGHGLRIAAGVAARHGGRMFAADGWVVLELPRDGGPGLAAESAGSLAYGDRRWAVGTKRRRRAANTGGEANASAASGRPGGAQGVRPGRR